MEYKTPGVYVEEISTLPPSVASVATAVPAFVGYTQLQPGKVENGIAIERINSMLEYESLFGKAQPKGISITTKTATAGKVEAQVVDSVDLADSNTYLMYYCLKHYFANGGGPCYVVSVGTYQGTAAWQKDDFSNGLARLKREDEPTLIVLADAVNLDADDYHQLCNESLTQCSATGDRFAIFDVLPDDPEAAEFRNKVAGDLKYGAAYLPHLVTTLNYDFDESKVSISGPGATTTGNNSETTFTGTFGDKGIVVTFIGKANDSPKVSVKQGKDFDIAIDEQLLKITKIADENGADVVDLFNLKFPTEADRAGFSVKAAGDGSKAVPKTTGSGTELESTPPVDGIEPPNSAVTLASIRETQTALYNEAKAAISKLRVVLPPSAAVAGVYARVDRERGVWKAPANVSLAAVIEPTIRVTDNDQDRLNVDPNAGKSINAIRSFTGKGTLVWGARTLAGNDNEWRYVNVRRLFNMIEESVQKSTAFAVFEANTATTWLKVKGMIESYLYSLWEQGALAGPTPDAAYFVQVGLGKTMTAQDILEGKMIVEIGVAAVRPAEFIILRFSHKLQEA
ncbi:MAG: phage tail sheath family protein [Planctomycetaceae bacterium]|nr:phage tail sheath family protein [Planctomycetaceae bacterium]MCB9950073.1 phage tail sheath family protein [Planctomycetaceae bacterium]